MSFNGRPWIVLAALAFSARLDAATATTDQRPAAERIESEISIHVPEGDVERVWQYLAHTYGGREGWPAGVDASALQARLSDESFVDRYYDTPALDVLAQQGGVRHRIRDIPGAPDDPKDDRQLVQVKLTSAGDTITRGEYKFPVKNSVIEHGAVGRTASDLIKEKHRRPFEKLMRGVGVDATRLEPVITLDQHRRRVYFADAKGPALTVTMDEVVARKWWATAPWTEIEIEIGEIRYTEASPAERAQLRDVRAAIRGDLMARFASLQEDDQPKYNEAFARLEKKLPLLRRAIGAREKLVPLTTAALVTAIVVAVGFAISRNRRGRPGPRRLVVVP